MWTISQLQNLKREEHAEHLWCHRWRPCGMSHVKKMEVWGKKVREKTEPRLCQAQNQDETQPLTCHRNHLASLSSVPTRLPLSQRESEPRSPTLLGHSVYAALALPPRQNQGGDGSPKEASGCRTRAMGDTQSHKSPLHVPGALLTPDPPAVAVSKVQCRRQGPGRKVSLASFSGEDIHTKCMLVFHNPHFQSFLCSFSHPSYLCFPLLFKIWTFSGFTLTERSCSLPSCWALVSMAQITCAGNGIVTQYCLHWAWILESPGLGPRSLHFVARDLSPWLGFWLLSHLLSQASGSLQWQSVFI